MTIVPRAGYILGIIGLILLLIGIKNVADFFGREDIFKNALYAVIFGIIGMVAALVFLLMGFLSLGFGISLMRALATIIIALVVLFIFYVLSAIFLKKSYDGMSEVLNIGLFGTAGLLYLIGAVLVIILIGFILILVAWILSAVAFFSINPSKYAAPAPAAPATGPPPTPSIEETPQPEPLEPS